MLKFIIILMAFSSNAFSEGSHPVAPQDWVEMHSIQPVILTWVKASPDKEIEEVPTFMVQKYPMSEKFQKFIAAYKRDSSGCFELTNKDWNQTWCVREKTVLALMSRGTDKGFPEVKEKLKAWVLTHD